MTEPLLTPLDLEEFRSGDPTRLVSAAGQEVRSYCGWHIAPEITETVTVEGLGAALLLPTLHLTGVTAIVGVVDGVAIDMSDVRWKPNGVVTGYPFVGDYEVTFTHGYATTPEDLAQVVAAVATRGLAGRRGVKSWTRGPFGETYDTDPDVAVLDRYRLPARP